MPIRIDGKISEGYVMLCETENGQHSFVARNLGPAIECPLCGRCDLTTKLVREFYHLQAQENAGLPARGEPVSHV
jgi:hypothetical protein